MLERARLLQQQQAAKYQKKKTLITGISSNRAPGNLVMGGQLSLEQMDLDRKTQFQGDAFDPFKVGTQS